MSSTKKLTTWKILEETIAAYSPDPNNLRAINHQGGCDYLTVDGKKCAIGRCMIRPPKFGSDQGGFFAKCFPNLDKKLKIRYRGHPVEFWTALQKLHDNPKNWTDTGLSETGETYAQFIREAF